MAAGDPFTMIASEVTTLEPVYNNVETPTESMKKEYFNIATTPLEQYELFFKARTDAQRDVILTHFNDQLGSHHDFSWTSVPNYIDSGNNITGRWVKGSFQMSVIGNKWNVTIQFEKEN